MINAIVLLCATAGVAGEQTAKAAERPNFLVLISDDQSWLHTGATGDRIVKTPHFDRVARGGVLFTHVFGSCPGCAPSRGAMLSGQAFWRLREGAVQRAAFPADIPVFPELLAAAGYQVGMQGKGWGPGGVSGRKHNPAGSKAPAFREFLADLAPGAPFCFWFGSTDPHRPYAAGSGQRSGKKPADVRVPPFLPDTPEVRSDLLDYYTEIERFDRDVGAMLEALDRAGKTANTLVLVTSDNGMPFPRAKTNLYDYGVRLPLAVRWPARVPAGRVVDDFISLADVAPTFLQAAGVQAPPQMTAHSFLKTLLTERAGRIDPSRDHVLFGRECHGRSWPCRGLRNDQYLYIRNFAPERLDGLVADNSPTKTFVVEHQRDPGYARFFTLAFGPRPKEELYDVREDPAQMQNLADRPERAAVLQQLRAQLEADLRESADPRILGGGEQFDKYPVAKPPAALSPSAAVASGRCDLAVIGGGSGGFGAALAAARLGIDVVLVEKAECLGGTSVRSGVNCWEMGAGGTGIPFDLYRELKRQPQAIAVYSFGRHGSWFDPQHESHRYPGGETVIAPTLRYLDTLQRHIPRGRRDNQALRRALWHGVPFEPDAMAQTMLAMLKETGRCRVLLSTAFVSAEAREGRVQSVTLSDGSQLRARHYVDATGDGLLCAAAGCRTMSGQEARDAFGEPDAPITATQRINGVSLIYRAALARVAAIEPLPADVPAECWWTKRFPGAHVNHYPNGDLNVNMLPTMEGAEFLRLGYDAALKECQRRVRAHWHDWQVRYEEFRQYRLSWIAPALGVRETQRIVGEYVLTENDLLAGLSRQKHPDIIALADHMMDTHGGHSAHRGQLSEPYGIPYRCLIPKGYRNLLVACRAASLSSLAASSCRLSRTMIQLGQAAGTAAALAIERNVDLPGVPSDRLRASLLRQHVQLEHPMPESLRSYLERESDAAESPKN